MEVFPHRIPSQSGSFVASQRKLRNTCPRQVFSFTFAALSRRGSLGTGEPWNRGALGESPKSADFFAVEDGLGQGVTLIAQLQQKKRGVLPQ